MYILKELGYNNFAMHHVIRDGISCAFTAKTNDVLVSSEFWGCTEVHVGDFADKTKFKESKYCGEIRVTYANEYFVKDLKDNFKKISFNISTYQSEKLEGYIIFIKRSTKDIKTNGEKIFGRYSNEIVAILREGQYLEYDGGVVKVINNELLLVI